MGLLLRLLPLRGLLLGRSCLLLLLPLLLGKLRPLHVWHLCRHRAVAATGPVHGGSSGTAAVAVGRGPLRFLLLQLLDHLAALLHPLVHLLRWVACSSSP